jgi:predicted house-cleaning NTP pyrophosphatase (Maf/HAM1 superfamily)
MLEAEVTYFGVLSIQVCVPSEWTDEEIIAFAERKSPCGTAGGWQIRRAGSELLKGDPERAS